MLDKCMKEEYPALCKKTGTRKSFFYRNRTLVLVVVFLFITWAGNATNYYVSNSGNDSHAGTTPETAWRTINKVNKTIFKPGDQILFKRSDTWLEPLTVSSSGSDSNPIVFGAYGSGVKPTIGGTINYSGWGEGVSAVEGSNIIPNSNFETGITYWGHTPATGGASSWTHETSNPINGVGSGTVAVTATGTNNTTPVIFDSSALRYLINGQQFTYGFKYRVNSGTCILYDIYYHSGIINETLSGSGVYSGTATYDANANYDTFAMRFDGSNLFSLTIDSVTVVPIHIEGSGDIYYVTGVMPPWFLVFNGSEYMRRESEKIGLNENNDFYFTHDGADTLFVYLDNPSDTANIRGNKVKFGIDFNAKSNVTIDNIHVTKSGFHNVYIDDNSDNIIVQNCLIDSAAVQGVHPSYCTNYTIYNDSIIDNGNDAIYINNQANYGEVYNNYIKGNGANPYTADRQAIGLWHANNVSIHDNYIEHHGRDGGLVVELTGWNVFNDNVSFYNNTVKYTGNGRIMSAFYGKYDIYNNLLVATDSAEYIINTGVTRNDANTPGGANIYNNTMIGSKTSLRLYDNNDGKISPDQSFRVKNNIMAGAQDLFIRINNYLIDLCVVEIDYNLYYEGVGDKFNYRSTYYTYDEWKTNSGYDANSPTPADPLFVSEFDDLQLQTGSPAINIGTNVGLTTDILGNPRVGNPDIGAYEKQ